MEKSVKSYGQGRKPAEKFIAMIDKYQDLDAMKLPHTRVGNYYIPGSGTGQAGAGQNCRQIWQSAAHLSETAQV